MSDTSDVMTTVAVVESRKRRSVYGCRPLVPHSLKKDKKKMELKSNMVRGGCMQDPSSVALSEVS